VSDVNGVVIPPKPEAGPTATMSGDDAATIIRQLRNVGLSKGYEAVRLDRYQHPLSGDWFECGYVFGEVWVRFSHQDRARFRHLDPRIAVEFASSLGANARRAFEEQGGLSA
jgi:hypothetical protein